MIVMRAKTYRLAIWHLLSACSVFLRTPLPLNRSIKQSSSSCGLPLQSPHLLTIALALAPRTPAEQRRRPTASRRLPSQIRNERGRVTPSHRGTNYSRRSFEPPSKSTHVPIGLRLLEVLLGDRASQLQVLLFFWRQRSELPRPYARYPSIAWRSLQASNTCG